MKKGKLHEPMKTSNTATLNRQAEHTPALQPAPTRRGAAEPNSCSGASQTARDALLFRGNAAFSFLIHTPDM